MPGVADLRPVGRQRGGVPAVGDLVQRLQLRHGQHLAGLGLLADGLTVDRAADQGHVLTDPEIRGKLVDTCGWSPEEHQDWLAEFLVGHPAQARRSARHSVTPKVRSTRPAVPGNEAAASATGTSRGSVTAISRPSWSTVALPAAWRLRTQSTSGP